MRPGDRLVCASVDRLVAGATFKDWPLHVTIVPWFRLDVDSKQITKDLADALVGFLPFDAHIGDENVRFGHQKGKLAAIVQTPTPFTEVECRVRDFLHAQRAWLVDETTKRPRTFRPHITKQPSGGLRNGDMFRCDRVYLIEQKGGHKEITGEVRLGV